MLCTFRSTSDWNLFCSPFCPRADSSLSVPDLCHPFHPSPYSPVNELCLLRLILTNLQFTYRFLFTNLLQFASDQLFSMLLYVSTKRVLPQPTFIYIPPPLPHTSLTLHAPLTLTCNHVLLHARTSFFLFLRLSLTPFSPSSAEVHHGGTFSSKCEQATE